MGRRVPFTRILVLACLGLALMLTSCGPRKGTAARYPTKPITLIVPVEAGSFQDTVTRPVAEVMAKELQQPVVVLNKPGAGGTIGLRDVKGAQPDGYTIGETVIAHYGKAIGRLDFDHNDLDVIGAFWAAPPIVWCRTEAPWRSLRELIEDARARPGKLTMATSSPPGYWWLVCKMLESVAGVRFDVVPQVGGEGMIPQQLAGGHVEAGLIGFVGAKPMWEAGKIRPLGVLGPQRLEALKDVPTAMEEGYSIGMEGALLGYLVGPKGMPEEATEALQAAFLRAAGSPQYQTFGAGQGISTMAVAGADAVRLIEEHASSLKPHLDRLIQEGLIK
ncbi:MAG: tripartite tricarboxylate transporter substrate binding protein [Bacillota bacterium]